MFAFLFSVAVGTLIGGPIGDKVGRKYVIWVSILGAAPFTLVMPYMGLMGTCVMSIFIGLIISSAFSAILVYAQELLPGKVGMIAGLFFGWHLALLVLHRQSWATLLMTEALNICIMFVPGCPLLVLLPVFFLI